MSPRLYGFISAPTRQFAPPKSMGLCCEQKNSPPRGVVSSNLFFVSGIQFVKSCQGEAFNKGSFRRARNEKE